MAMRQCYFKSYKKESYKMTDIKINKHPKIFTFDNQSPKIVET